MTYAASAAAYPHAHSLFEPVSEYGASTDAFELRNVFKSLKESFCLAATWQRKQDHLDAAVERLTNLITAPIQHEEISEQPSKNTIREAILLLQALPVEMPQPDITTEPSGAIALEWYRGRNNVFILSANGTGSLEYAGLHGSGNEMHGRVNFVNNFPMPLQNLLAIFLSAAG